MKIEKRVKDTFAVIGKEGSTSDGHGFIQKLWSDANSHFREVQPLAKKDENGNLVGIWGAMSDCSHSFKTWENNFSKGLYLAGVECVDDAEAPEGWTKWTIPGYEYLCVEVERESTFSDVLDYMNTNCIALVGAVHDFTCPASGKNYMFFPIRTIRSNSNLPNHHTIGTVGDGFPVPRERRSKNLSKFRFTKEMTE